MTPAVLALIPSALPARPGSVEVHLICECGARFDAPVHSSITERFMAIFRRVHDRPGCAVTEGK